MSSSSRSASSTLDQWSTDFSPATIESCPKIDRQQHSSSSVNSQPSFSGRIFVENFDLTRSTSSAFSSLSASAITEEIVRIQSPKYGLTTVQTPMGYEPFLDCDYLIQKSSPNVCALEIRFESFALEDSRLCNKDYLEISDQSGAGGMKLCGRLPKNTISK